MSDREREREKEGEDSEEEEQKEDEEKEGGGNTPRQGRGGRGGSQGGVGRGGGRIVDLAVESYQRSEGRGINHPSVLSGGVGIKVP